MGSSWIVVAKLHQKTYFVYMIEWRNPCCREEPVYIYEIVKQNRVTKHLLQNILIEYSIEYSKYSMKEY